jgi:hypothetical protein
LKDATLYFSRGSPNLAAVIPAMDHIDTVFTNAALPSSNLNPAIRVAVGIAKKTLNRYYSLTDASESYRVAMSKLIPTIFKTAFLIIVYKFFTLVTNLPTSEPQDGPMNGLRRQRKLFTNGLIQNMPPLFLLTAAAKRPTMVARSGTQETPRMS